MWPRNWILSSAADLVLVTLPTLCLLGASSTGVVHSGDNYMRVTRVSVAQCGARCVLSGEDESENPGRSCDTVRITAPPEPENEKPSGRAPIIDNPRVRASRYAQASLHSPPMRSLIDSVLARWNRPSPPGHTPLVTSSPTASYHPKMEGPR